MVKKINAPLTKEVTETLVAGDIIHITGTIYTARDAAHKKMIEEYEAIGKFPFDMTGAVIYYAGPAPAKPGQPIGSVGPTTSYRMDSYAPFLLDRGELGMVGKGSRSLEVVESMKKNSAVYFAATGGAGALISNQVKAAEVVAYPELGAEAVHKLEVEDFPCTVVIDCLGNNLYESEKSKYRQL